MPESFRAKVTAIEESKDLDDIKIQELIGFLQTYELSLPNQRKSKSLILKTVNEMVDVYDSLDDDVVEKDVAYLAKNFRKFLKFKNSGKFGNKGKFMNSRKEKKDFKKRIIILLKTGCILVFFNIRLFQNSYGFFITMIPKFLHKQIQSFEDST